MGATYYQAAVFAVLAIILCGGVYDFALWLSGDETISEWLTTGHMAWFWIPAGAMLAFLVGLGTHLLTLKGQ